ncbi:MAG: tetratricopeptide repeat protein [Bacteroidota bacterium]
MSEMLGNQYFMARNYVNAEKELEPVYLKESDNKPVRRKLIICYVQTRKLDKALNIFHALVNEDITFITTADTVLDDCPCAELLNNFKETHEFSEEYEYNLSHGMLWLYCDEKKAVHYLKKALKETPANEKLKNVVEAIKKYNKSVKAN